MTGPSGASRRNGGSASDAADEGRLPPVERNIAPDGQRVVDQSKDRDEERAAIAEASEQQDALAREERAQEHDRR